MFWVRASLAIRTNGLGHNNSQTYGLFENCAWIDGCRVATHFAPSFMYIGLSELDHLILCFCHPGFAGKGYKTLQFCHHL